MARFHCACGESMRFEVTGFHLLTDHQLIDELQCERPLGELYIPIKKIMVCPECSRIHWFEGDELKKTFALEPT